MTVFEKLKIKIQDDTGLECENFKRTRAGVRMKSSGAPVWTANVVGSVLEVGSGEPATELLRRAKLEKTPGWTFGSYDIN